MTTPLTIAKALREQADLLRLECEARIGTLIAAAELLENGGHSSPTPALHTGPAETKRDRSVPELILAALAGKTIGLVVPFDELDAAVFDIARDLDEQEKYKRGRYNAIKSLNRSGHIRATPQGVAPLSLTGPTEDPSGHEREFMADQALNKKE